MLLQPCAASTGNQLSSQLQDSLVRSSRKVVLLTACKMVTGESPSMATFVAKSEVVLAWAQHHYAAVHALQDSMEAHVSAILAQCYTLHGARRRYRRV